MNAVSRAGEGEMIWLSPADRLKLRVMAADCGMEPDEFVAALVAAHLSRAPHWNAETYSGLRDVSAAVRQIGDLVRVMPESRDRIVTDMVLALARRLDAMMADQQEYWGAQRQPVLA